MNVKFKLLLEETKLKNKLTLTLIHLEDCNEGEDTVEQSCWVGNENLLMIHRQRGYKKFRCRERAPHYRKTRHNRSQQTPVNRSAGEEERK